MRCSRCGHQFVGNPPSASNLDDAYGEGYYRSTAALETAPKGYVDYLANCEHRVVGFRSRLATVQKYCAPGRILDIGCAVGLFLVAAREGGWEATGYERSAWASQYGRVNFGVDIVTGNSTVDSFPGESFDAISMWDVLEHIEDPMSSIENVAKWLVPGGVVALSTVNAGALSARLAGKSWRHLAPPHHLHYFTLQSLMKMLNAHGFSLLEMRANGIFIDVDALSGWLRGFGAAVNAVVCNWRIRGIISHLNVLDEIDIVARLDA